MKGVPVPAYRQSTVLSRASLVPKWRRMKGQADQWLSVLVGVAILLTLCFWSKSFHGNGLLHNSVPASVRSDS